MTTLTSAELAAWRGMLRVGNALMRELDAELESGFGISLSSYDVLISVADSAEGRLRMAELADLTLLSRSGMTRLVDRLVKDGLLERERCDSDARGAFARLTPKGRELLERARPAHREDVRRRFHSKLDEDQLQQLAEIWEQLVPGASQT
jgi:DNA-binding MarR family transcriptional regulator